MSIIILRDIPKDVVQIDLMLYQVKGGFRGFCDLPPGLHYIALPGDGRWPSCWCYVQSDEVAVRLFLRDSQQFVKDASEEATSYRQLANNGVMDSALQPYAVDQQEVWRSLTQYITAPNATLLNPSKLVEGTVERSRFEQVFLDHHKGNVEAFLGDFQFAFINWLMVLNHTPNGTTPQRWPQLLNALYNAGDRQISQNSHLFNVLVSVILAQFAQLPSHWLAPKSLVCTHLDYLIEDMADMEITILQKQAQALKDYVRQQQKEG